MTTGLPSTTVPTTAATPAPQVSLSADEARRIALRAQGLLGAPDRRAGVRGMLRQLGAVQLDTISVLARSHELVPFARLGPVGRQAVESAFWSDSHSFEYWSHAACVLPIEEWPHFAFRRRAFRDRGHRWHRMQDREGSCAAVRDRLKSEGPLTTAGLGGGRNGGEWWDWSESKIAVEWLLDIGEVVVTERRGWKRVYDLAERAVPEALFHDELDDHECLRRLVTQAGAALGVATRADLADYHRLKAEQVDAVLADTGLVPVEVQGWPRPGWADPAALESTPRGRHRTTLLSPFDSLIWDRPAPNASSASYTGWRRTSRSPSGCTATSRCPCWRGASWSAAWTRPGRARRSWPASSRWRARRPWSRWPEPWARPPPGWAATRYGSSAATRKSCAPG